MPASRFISTILAIILSAIWAASANAETFNQRVKKANRQLLDGDSEGALSMFRDLQTDEPESPLLYYGQGCAQYKQGEKELVAPTPEHAIEAFRAARDSFTKASQSSDERTRRNALYNGATTETQLAELSVKAGDAKGAEDSFKGAIGQYEDLLKRHPGDAAAKNNLDHTRYMLKKLLQNPPKPQDQKNQQGQAQKSDKQQDSGQKQDSGQQQGQSAEGEKKDQQGEQGQKQQEQAQAQPQSESKNDGEKDSEHQKDNDRSTESEKKQQLADAKKLDSQQQSHSQSPDKQSDKQNADRQSVEALLDTLEAQDNREQKDLQSARGNVRMRRDWW